MNKEVEEKMEEIKNEVKEKDTVIFGVYIPKELYKKIKILSINKDKTLKEIVTEALETYLQQNQ